MTVTDAFLKALAAEVAPLMAPLVASAVVAQLRAEGFGRPQYATAKENPCGSRKAFLRGCREKGFESFKRGRELSADWAAVEAWWRAQAAPGDAPAKPANDLAAELQEAAGAGPRRRRRA